MSVIVKNEALVRSIKHKSPALISMKEIVSVREIPFAP